MYSVKIRSEEVTDSHPVTALFCCVLMHHFSASLCYTMDRTNVNRLGVFPLENIRLKYTNLTQEEFCVYAGITRNTYLRWKKQNLTAPPLTPDQVVKICKLTGLTLTELFEQLEIDLSGVPKRSKKQVSLTPSIA